MSADGRKSWLLSKACKGLDVPEELCEALLSDDKAQIDLSTFLDGGDLASSVWHRQSSYVLVQRQPSSALLQAPRLPF